MIVWISGPAGSGKTTLARKIKGSIGSSPVLLDGDECRQWLTPDCDFSDEGRRTNVERAWIVANLIHISGGLVICSFVTPAPYHVGMNIQLVGRERNPPWEGTQWPTPKNPDLVLDTGEKGIEECLEAILEHPRFLSGVGSLRMRAINNSSVGH